MGHQGLQVRQGVCRLRRAGVLWHCRYGKQRAAGRQNGLHGASDEPASPARCAQSQTGGHREGHGDPAGWEACGKLTALKMWRVGEQRGRPDRCWLLTLRYLESSSTFCSSCVSSSLWKDFS